jgi:peroxiredoxin
MLARALLTAALALAFGCSEEPAATRAYGQAAAAAIGLPAPDFALPDTDGKVLKLSSLRGRIVILEWFNPDCPFVRHAHTKGPLKDLAKRVSNDKLIWLSINSNAPGKQGHGVERNRSAKQEYGMTNRLLLDESGKTGQAYGALKTPHLFVINASGLLVYRGGLDNAPIGVVDNDRPHAPGNPANALERYLENALADLAHNLPVQLADTPAYGCTVKYAD